MVGPVENEAAPSSFPNYFRLNNLRYSSVDLLQCLALSEDFDAASTAYEMDC
jgi:hypothetical protein